MKPNELMLGDLVTDSTDSVVVFDGIGCADNNDNCDRYAGVINTKQNRRYNEHIAKIQPILLTNAMLLENGFEECGTAYTYYKLTSGYGKYIRLHPGPCGYTAVDNVMEIRYVHQLQNLLRVCDFDNYADNFKIF